MEQSKADPCLFFKVVDGEVTLIVCIYLDDLVVAAKEKEVSDALYSQLLEKFPVNDMGGCAFERDKV